MIAKLQDFNKRKREASAILITSSRDEPFQVMQKHSRSPTKMWAKICARDASRTTSNKLSLFTEAFSKTKESESISDHITVLETVFAQLEDAGQSFEELMQVSILLSSITDDRHYEAAIAAIRTMDEEKTTWEYVTVRLLEKSKEKTSQNLAWI